MPFIKSILIYRQEHYIGCSALVYRIHVERSVVVRFQIGSGPAPGS